MEYLPAILLIVILVAGVSFLVSGFRTKDQKAAKKLKSYGRTLIFIPAIWLTIAAIVLMLAQPILFFGLAVSGLIGVVIGERKGRRLAGFLFGALLGPIGWVVVLLGPDLKAQQEATRLRKCPYCAELVQPDAKVCKHCGRDIAPLVAQPSPEPAIREVEQPAVNSTIQEYEHWKKSQGL